MYLGFDCSRFSDEQRKLLKRAKKKAMTKNDVFDAMQTEGVFALISGKEYSIDEILPACYQRQEGEQIFDGVKNYTKTLPLRTDEPETYYGYLLLGFIASCAVKLIQLRLQSENHIGSCLASLRNIKCTIYEESVVTDVPQAEARAAFEASDLECPVEIPVKRGILQYRYPAEDASLCSKEAAPDQKPAHRCRGRPKGSKNKKTLVREAARQSLESQPPKRKRGRPKGSKNKSTLAKEAAARKEAASTIR